MQPVVIPAILAKSKEELLHRIHQVSGLVGEIQLDIMDGDFVPNKTIGIDALEHLPKAKYEFHWMVRNPEKWIPAVRGPHMHIIHVETILDFSAIESAVKKAGGRLGIALNPETPPESIAPFLSKVKRVLVMTVHPGFSGQSYLPAMEHKIRKIRELAPKMDIEVDGGINLQTIGRAYAAGANILAAASAIFSSDDIKTAIKALKEQAAAGGSS